VDYVALDVELMLYGDVADESFESISDFFDEFTIRIFENQNMLNTDISHITYEGVEYHYDTNYWSWTDASGNYLEMVISDMLHDSWIINQEPIYSFTITIVDVNGVSTDLTLTFVFE